MNHSDDDLRQAIALFRYGVIADLVHLPVGAKGTGTMMRAKAEQTYTIPGTDRTRVAAGTIGGWVRAYRDGGFDALYPKPRTDRGQPRRLAPKVAERLVALKIENPACSVRLIIARARAEGIEDPLAPSTVHRLFSREGLFDRQAGGGRRRPPPLRLPRGRGALDERRHARAEGPARAPPAQELPHRLHRRRHPRRSLRRLRHSPRTSRPSCPCSRTR